jgi:hypothetical protein
MFSLPDAAIIIPVRVDHSQRKQNLERNLAFLKTHFQTTIVVIEQDKTQQIEGSMFIHNGDTFHKTRLFNLAAKENPKSMYYFLDTDVLVDPQAYVDAYNVILRDNRCDLCLLYKRNDRYEYVDFEPDILDKNPDPLSWADLLKGIHGTQAKCCGGVVAVRSSTFFNAGRFNEYFIGYGQEDWEFLLRLQRFGARYFELPYSIYHQKHEVFYRAKGLIDEHISPYLVEYSTIQDLTTLKYMFTNTDTRYVSLRTKGGRLGNILFQLATVLQYAKRTNRIPWMEIPEVYKPFFAPILRFLKKPPSNERAVLVTGQLSSDSSVFYNEVPLVLTKDVCIEIDPGFAQSSNMIDLVRWFLQEQLAPKKERKPNTDVVIHVRRTDYTHYSNIYEQLGEHYYVRAINAMKKNIPECRFVVFTDDITSVRQLPYFQREDLIFFDDSGLKDYEVLQEMTLYSHFILANSAFSWWGAQLSSTQGHVIAPLHWSNVHSPTCLGFWTPIYEEHWIRLSNFPMTVRTTHPLFDVFAPQSGERANIEVVSSHDFDPNVRRNADLVFLITHDPKPYLAVQKPRSIDYIISTSWEHISIPHSSWKGCPVLCIPLLEMNHAFHRLQGVFETLLKPRPELTIIMVTKPNVRSNLVFETLDTVYRQTYHTWEILFVPTHSYTNAIGSLFFNRIAIPKLLPVLPLGGKFLQHAFYARSDPCAVVYGGTLLHQKKFETQMRNFDRGALSLTPVYENSAYYPYTSFTRKFGLLDNKKVFLASIIFHRSILTDRYSQIPDTARLQMSHGVDVRFVSDKFSIPESTEKTERIESKEEAPSTIRNYVQHPLVSGSIGIVTKPVYI